MERARTPETHRFCLAPGTRVGDWRVLGCCGHGAYGVVHRAVREGQEPSQVVALKLALYPWDPRFMREVGLLSLVQHESVPRLRGHGFWKRPEGTVHPFVVMEWVDGPRLYDWASQCPPSARQVMRVLAQLARALEATHAAGAVHRDVKGDNVLVRRTDGRAMLADFGSGHYQAAARVTWQPMAPGTPAYRSPEAGLFFIRSVRTPDAHYPGRPADDVFALGVTAYRLVTGEYPAQAEPQMDEEGAWSMQEAQVKLPRELRPRVDGQLEALILRMLALSPEARGTARELAETLEAAAQQAGPEADQPLWEAEPAREREPVLAPVAVDGAREELPLQTEELRRPQRWMKWRGLPEWTPWVGAVLGAVVLIVGTWRAVRAGAENTPTRQAVVFDAGRPDAGTTDLGDTASVSTLASMSVPKGAEPIAQELPPEPLPGQLRPDTKGQCPGREQVAINGGCWVEFRATDTETCGQNGYVFFRKKCYAPALTPRRRPQPTSDSPDAR